MAGQVDNGLWAITSYFNPLGYRRRLANYHTFRRRLNVPLVTVEWSWSGGQGFQLGDGDAEVLIQRSGPDLLFQKERLLNLAVAALPSDCRYVAWIDCDVLFEEDDWPMATAAALQEHRVAHLFSEGIDLAPDASDVGGPGVYRRVSAPAAIAQTSTDDVLVRKNLHPRGVSVGFAWACDVELARRHGFYDGCPLGSADRAMISAAYGRPVDAETVLHMNPAWSAHYRAWAGPYFEDVAGRVTSLPGRVYHLWHGDLADRKYLARYEAFQPFKFDPATDLVLDEQGVWRWSGGKPDIPAFVEAYFASRREDG